MGSRRLNGKLNIISENLIKYRKRQGISQEVLCKKLELLGLTMIPNDIYKIENNLRTVKDYELNAFAKVLKVDINDFYKGTDKYYM